MAQDSTFKVEVTDKSRGIYRDMAKTVSDSCDPVASQRVQTYMSAYNDCRAEIKDAKREIDARVSPVRVSESVSLKAADRAELFVPEPELDALASAQVAITTREDAAAALARIGDTKAVTSDMKKRLEETKAAGITRESDLENGSTVPKVGG